MDWDRARKMTGEWCHVSGSAGGAVEVTAAGMQLVRDQR